MLGPIVGSVLACGGCFGFLPMILAAVALVDSIRVGAGWYWCLIILALPIIGPIAYFVVVRSALLGSRGATFMSHSTARRLQARRHLKALQVQLGHWRGPGVLTEAGEDLLVLGKNKEAEAHFREALENGAAVEDVAFGLGQALQAQGRFGDAAPFLEQLVAIEPDARLGEGPLALARCLDESGRREEAVPVLRRVLERRTVVEAQVRLARILLQQGKKEEADPLLAEIAADAKALPSYLKRRYGGWLRAARGLRPGTKLPRPRVDGAITFRERLQVAAIALGAILVLLVAGIYVYTMGLGGWQAQEIMQHYEETRRLRDRLDEIDRTSRWTRGDDLALVDLTSADLDRYVRVRRGLEPSLRQASGASDPRLEMESEAAFLRSLIAELEREKMGTRELGNLVALIEWRFLRRPEALVFGLPDYERPDWLASREALVPPPVENGPDDDSELARLAREQRRWQARLRAKAEAMEREANAAVALSPATQALLGSRRAELAAFDPAFLAQLLRGIDPSLGGETDWRE